MKFGGANLDNKDGMMGKSDPFAVFSRLNGVHAPPYPLIMKDNPFSSLP